MIFNLWWLLKIVHVDLDKLAGYTYCLLLMASSQIVLTRSHWNDHTTSLHLTVLPSDCSRIVSCRCILLESLCSKKANATQPTQSSLVDGLDKIVLGWKRGIHNLLWLRLWWNHFRKSHHKTIHVRPHKQLRSHLKQHFISLKLTSKVFKIKTLKSSSLYRKTFPWQ